MDNQINNPNNSEQRPQPVVANNGPSTVQNTTAHNNGYPPPFQWGNSNAPRYTPVNNNPVYNCGPVNNEPLQSAQSSEGNKSESRVNEGAATQATPSESGAEKTCTAFNQAPAGNVNQGFNNPDFNRNANFGGNPNFNRNPNFGGNPNFNRNPNFGGTPNYNGNPDASRGFNNQQGNAGPSFNNQGFNNPNFAGNGNVFANNMNGNQGYVPQYHPGAAYYPVFNRQYYEERQRLLFARKSAEKKIRSISNLAGGNLIFSFVISNLFSFLFFIPFISDLYDSSLSGVSILNIFYSIITVAGGFMLYDIVFKKHAGKLAQANGGVDCFNFKTSYGAPKDIKKTILLIFIGFGGCMIANYVSNIFLTFFEMFGFTSTYSAVEDPENIQDIILMCISTAVIPPLTEELAIRGLLMSRMRRYGNWFAIFTSAFIFGVFHGTVAQIPFAFVCGLFIGYAVIATDSIWTGVFIHALNNGISCLCSILIEYTGEETANIIWMFISYGGLGLGLLCFVIYYNMYKKKKTEATGIQKIVELSRSSVTAPLYDGVSEYQGDGFELSQKQKIVAFLKSPAVILGTVMYLLISLFSMEFTF